MLGLKLNHVSKRGHRYSSGLFPITSSTITWHIHDGEPTTCIKFINLHKKSRQSLRQQICHKVLFTSIQADPDDTHEWLGCVGTKWWDKFGIINFPLALSGRVTIFWLLTPSCQWSYERLWSWNIWLRQAPLTRERLRVELNVAHNVRVRALNSQFCWDLVPSELTTLRHYRLLRTRSWSHRQ